MSAKACKLDPSSSVRRPPIRSQIQPDARRLTTPKPSISDSISAPRAAPCPRSPEYATMWTCGIDIATQQLSPAMISTACSAAGDIPRGREMCDATCGGAEVASVSGDRRRRASANGTMDATQKTPMPTYVGRQPALPKKCCTTGGQTVPRSEEHTSELQSQSNLVCRLLLEKKKKYHLQDNVPP